MKQKICKIIRSISKKCNFDTISKISEKWRVLRSEWVAGKMAAVGKGCYFRSVAQLHDTQFIHIGDNNCFGKDLYLTAWRGGAKYAYTDYWQ